MKRMMFALFACFSCITFADQSAAAEATNAEKIVGIWNLVKLDGKESKDEAVSYEFTKDGKMKSSRGPEGTYKVDGDKFTVTVKVDGKDDNGNAAIKMLTTGTLVLVYDTGKKMELKKK